LCCRLIMMGKIVFALALIAACTTADFSDEYVPEAVETELVQHHVVGFHHHGKHTGVVKKNLDKALKQAKADHKAAKKKAHADHKKLVSKVVSAHSTKWANHQASKLTRASRTYARTYQILKRAERARFGYARRLKIRAAKEMRKAHRKIYKANKNLVRYKYKTFYALKKLAHAAKKMMKKKHAFHKKMKKVQKAVKKAHKKAKKATAKRTKAHKKTMKKLSKAKKALQAKARHLNKRWAQAQAAAARRNKRAAARYGKTVKYLAHKNKRSIHKFNRRVARGKAYFARRVKSNKRRASFAIFQLRAKNNMVRLAARLAARRERRYNKREARNKKKMAMREARQKKHAKKVLKMNRHKESMKKARKAALSKAKFQRKMEKSNKMKEKAKKAKAKAAAAKKAAEKASKAEAKATKKALAKDAAIKSCPFTGPAMCQNKKKNHKCTKVNEKKGPWMANDFVTCSWKKPKAAAADSGLAWAGFGGFGAFKETKFEMPAFKMPAMPKW